MVKNIIIPILQLLLIMMHINCKISTEPDNENKNIIFCEPKSIEFNVNADSLETEQFPKYSREYSTLERIGIDLTSLKYYYPNPDHNFIVDKEFVVTTNDSFEVELKNCNSKYNWFVDIGNIEGPNSWINTEIKLLRIKNYINSDSTITYQFIFQSLKRGKGYICFIEENQSGEISSNGSHGLLIRYSIDPLNRIYLNLDEIKWIYNIEEGTFSTVSVALKGTTNCYRLRGMTYGDGVIMAMEIPTQDDNSFEIEIPVAFSHVQGITLKTSSELLLYGTVGLPKIVPLVNPKSDE